MNGNSILNVKKILTVDIGSLRLMSGYKIILVRGSQRFNVLKYKQSNKIDYTEPRMQS